MENDPSFTPKPVDVHNVRLRDETHPVDWQNPKPASCYNLVAIGGGTAGLVAAGGGAHLGGKAALIERDLLGGDCLVHGCVPSKALIRAAHAAQAVKEAQEFGIGGKGTPEIDFGRVMESMRESRAEISEHDAAARFREMGVDVFFGQARFTSPNTIEVGGEILRFARAVVATGSRPAIPPLDGIDEVDYLTNESIFSLTEKPKSLAVIGGGPLGCELAQAFQRFGVPTTVLLRGDRILSHDDPEAAALVEEQMERDGVTFLRNAEVSSVAQESREGPKTIRYTQAGKPGDVLTAGALLIATGRKPNVEGLGLKAAGVEFDARRGVRVDDYLRTTNSRIYASGDVCLTHKLTHAADQSSRIVLANALFFPKLQRFSEVVIPHCTFTDPELAHVGMTWKEAAAAGESIVTLTEHFSHVDRAITDKETGGFLRIHAERRTGRVRGATLVGRGAGDMISELTVAVQHKIKLSALSSTIHPYPTRAEVIKRLADQFGSQRLARWKPLLAKWMAFRR